MIVIARMLGSEVALKEIERQRGTGILETISFVSRFGNGWLSRGGMHRRN